MRMLDALQPLPCHAVPCLAEPRLTPPIRDSWHFAPESRLYESADRYGVALAVPRLATPLHSTPRQSSPFGSYRHPDQHSLNASPAGYSPCLSLPCRAVPCPTIPLHGLRAQKSCSLGSGSEKGLGNPPGKMNSSLAPNFLGGSDPALCIHSSVTTRSCQTKKPLARRGFAFFAAYQASEA